jgi:hypothetical protein
METANDVVDILPWIWVWAMMAMDALPIPIVSLIAVVLSIVGVVIQYLLFKAKRIKIFPKIIDMGNIITFGALYILALWYACHHMHSTLNIVCCLLSASFSSATLINWFDCLQVHTNILNSLLVFAHLLHLSNPQNGAIFLLIALPLLCGMPFTADVRVVFRLPCSCSSPLELTLCPSLIPRCSHILVCERKAPRKSVGRSGF